MGDVIRLKEAAVIRAANVIYTKKKKRIKLFERLMLTVHTKLISRSIVQVKSPKSFALKLFETT